MPQPRATNLDHTPQSSCARPVVSLTLPEGHHDPPYHQSLILPTLKPPVFKFEANTLALQDGPL